MKTYTSYNIVGFAERVLESEIYNENIYKSILAAKQEIEKIDMQTAKYEVCCGESLTEKQVEIREKLFNAALNRREKVAQNLHNYLIENSEKYCAEVMIFDNDIKDNNGKYTNKYTLLYDNDINVIESYNFDILDLANNIGKLVRLIQINRDNEKLAESLRELYYNIVEEKDAKKYNRIVYSKEETKKVKTSEKEFITTFLQPERKYIYIGDNYMEYIIKVRNTKKNLSLLLHYKEEKEKDFDFCERDCTGSTQIRIKCKVRKNYITLHFCESIDW